MCIHTIEDREMKIKTSELTGAALDWAVAKCEGFIEDCNGWLYQATLEEVEDGSYHPSTNWAQGGPIIERESMGVFPLEEGWASGFQNGPTLLVAAMRHHVASELGDTVDIPEELL
jgi:hypothetical protein